MAKHPKLPRYLYHGTTEAAAHNALLFGLRPRSETNSKGNWEHTECPSHPECVYLTTVYSPYFAATAAYMDARWAMVEIDTEKLVLPKFRPDEDCLEQGTRNLPDRFDEGKMNIMERTIHFRDNQDKFKDNWKLTLEVLGTVAYKGIIPPDAITRVAFYDPKVKENGVITLDTYGASIILMNHKFCHEQYKNLTRWMFGETITIAEYKGGDGWEQIIPPEYLAELNRVLSGEYGGREVIVNAVENTLTTAT